MTSWICRPAGCDTFDTLMSVLCGWSVTDHLGPSLWGSHLCSRWMRGWSWSVGMSFPLGVFELLEQPVVLFFQLSHFFCLLAPFFLIAYLAAVSFFSSSCIWAWRICNTATWLSVELLLSVVDTIVAEILVGGQRLFGPHGERQLYLCGRRGQSDIVPRRCPAAT